jgi:hypothetical protein
VITAVCLAAMSAAGEGDRLTEKQLSLSGIKTLCVSVQGVTEEVKKAGLSAEQIKSGVEEKLKAIGIKAVSEEEAEKLPGKPSIYVNVSVHKRERVAAFMFHIDVGVLQEAELVRDPKIQIMSITWIKGRTGECPSRGLVKAMEETINYLMEEFCKDYRKANPVVETEN